MAASVYQCSAARATTMPTRRSKRRPSFDPAEASVLALKALARSGELPGCKCYRELREEEFLRAAPCEHVLTKAVDVLLEQAAKRPASRPAPSARHLANLESLLDGELSHLRQAIESDEPLSDDELDKIEQALEATEQKRKPPSAPTAALTREAMIQAYGKRYDAGEHLWCPDDAVQRQGSRAALESARKEDHRFGRVEVAVESPDGKVRVIERAVVQTGGGAVRVIGEQPKQEGGEGHV